MALLASSYSPNENIHSPIKEALIAEAFPGEKNPVCNEKNKEQVSQALKKNIESVETQIASQLRADKKTNSPDGPANEGAR